MAKDCAHATPRRRRGVGLLYVAVVLASLLSAVLQPGHAEGAPADGIALLDLSNWADDAAGQATESMPSEANVVSDHAR